MDECVETMLKKTDLSTTPAQPQQKAPRQYRMHGRHVRDSAIKRRGLAAIDRRSVQGREALAWRDHAIKAKGGAVCPFAIKVEINAATFDLWRLLHLQTFLIADANDRGTIVNRRKRELSRIHDQYDAIDARFMRRCEALNLGKQPVMDLATRLRLAQQAAKQ
jgi:hypothetical protein